jgi:hypothetical protein
MNSNSQAKLKIIYYRKFLKSANMLNFYNFRVHAIRKIQHDFRQNNNEISEQKFIEKLNELQRIVIVQNLYSSNESVGKLKYSEY